MKTIVSKYILLTILFTNFTTCFISQELRRSSTYIDTYYHGEKHFSIKDASFIFYSPANGEMYITLNFADLKCGVDSLDEWLLDLTDTKLVFKGHLQSNDLLSLTHHNLKSLEVNGQISFNGKSHNHSVMIHFFEISREGLLFMNNSQDYFDRVAANIQFTFFPKEFGIQKKPHHLKKKISVAIGKGIINEFKAEHESFIK